MADDIGRIKIGAALTVALSLAIVLLAPSPVVPATSYIVGNGETSLSIEDYSTLPQYMVDEARALAAELFGDNAEKCDEFIGQLLATYLAARDKDVVIIFNLGGWGWSALSETREGESFFSGIESELNAMGYSLLFLNHKRTARTFNSSMSEFMLAAGIYPSKAQDLAARIEFLIKNIPGIRVIVTGVSNGTLICDEVVDILEDNPQVYSIQMGPPFWNNAASTERSLVIRGNGVTPDSFSRGDFLAIIRANIESFFGLPQEYLGDILLYIEAPGHDYSWQYPAVRSQITDFLRANFGPKE